MEDCIRTRWVSKKYVSCSNNYVLKLFVETTPSTSWCSPLCKGIFRNEHGKPYKLCICVLHNNVYISCFEDGPSTAVSLSSWSSTNQELAVWANKKLYYVVITGSKRFAISSLVFQKEAIITLTGQQMQVFPSTIDSCLQ